MLFTSKKRGPDWYFSCMVLLYAFSLLSCAGVIEIILFSDLVLAERVSTGLFFCLIAPITWILGRRCSAKLTQLNEDDRNR